MRGFSLENNGRGDFYSGLATTSLIMFVNTWDEFEKSAQNIYLSNPDKVSLRFPLLFLNLCVVFDIFLLLMANYVFVYIRLQ